MFNLNLWCLIACWFPERTNILLDLRLNSLFEIRPSMHASKPAKLPPAPFLLLVLQPNAIALVSQLMYSLQVLFPKIDWIDRMIIAFKQHKTPVVQPVAGRLWRDLSFSVGEAFICPLCGSSASMKNVTFVSICRTDAFQSGFLSPYPQSGLIWKDPGTGRSAAF